MITRQNIPTNYEPYTTLTVCSNTLSGGGHIVAIRDVLPLIIGQGKKPKIWLQAISDANKNEFVTIVEESISKHPAVKVYEEAGYLNVMISGEIILSVKSETPDSVSVDKLDLRALGLNMHGDKNSLTVGGGTFTGNSMHGGGTLIGFG